MAWALEDTGRVSGYDPYTAIALDRIGPRWRRPMAWYAQHDIRRLLRGDRLYCWPRQVVYAIYAADIEATYLCVRFDWALSMWTTRLHTLAKMAIDRVIHCRV
jgi:hypothetical protein